MYESSVVESREAVGTAEVHGDPSATLRASSSTSFGCRLTALSMTERIRFASVGDSECANRHSGTGPASPATPSKKLGYEPALARIGVS